MKKLVYALLVLAYVTVAYLSVYVLPHYYSGAIIGAAGASLGASFKQFKEVKASPDKALLAYFKRDEKKASSLLLVLLGIFLFVSLVLEFNWQYGLAFVVAISYAMLWNVLHIQFLRKYYFKNA
ncbi:TPA: hypothetical protein ACIRJ4_001228 [Streptococcus suis]|uniref:Membrane protein n=3 Tax=Streptococcus suis TaxID=1307 RepID=A0A0H3MWV2_STRS4|nr:hypothetical protein [Streptococcus suis]ADV70785.1 hypothetical protein SSUJS14_1727 [Streptococcus suis JS14]AER15882.1 hypothetical protein SSU12_1705 [Streptococcus suis SS12]AER44908.1 hypothetical protein SSUA7_1589 [Streptococcus suis A7]AFR01014.1 hypothetical protein YYK_07515 [Streptococcus suis S735]AKG40993.1 membrane protein [Streptococcus suis]